MTKDEILAKLKARGLVVNASTLPEIERLLLPYQSIGRAQSNTAAIAILERLMDAATSAGKVPRFARELSEFIAEDLNGERALKRQQMGESVRNDRDATRAEHHVRVLEGDQHCREHAKALIKSADSERLNDPKIQALANQLSDALEKGGICTLVYSRLKMALRKARKDKPL